MANSVEYLPFDSVWKMQIDHPYSLFVKDEGLFWSCGQCPLNEQGQVQSPNDLLSQAKLVHSYIEQFLSKIHCETTSVAQLVIYYVSTSSSDGQTLRDLYHQLFGPEVIVLTVAIPHFYYDGMMVEVDVFGSTDQKQFVNYTDESTSTTLNIVYAGQLTVASLVVPKTSVLMPRVSGRELKKVVDRLLERADLSFDNLFSEQWFAVGAKTATLVEDMRCGNLMNVCQIVETTHVGFDVVGQLAFSHAHVRREGYDEATDKYLSISLVRSRDLFEVMGTDDTLDSGIVAQTERIMTNIEGMMNKAKLSFEQVRKVTTYYVGGSSADELHDNMSIRNRYYSKPGPASTGLPVYSFPQTLDGKIVIRILGRCKDVAREENQNSD